MNMSEVPTANRIIAFRICVSSINHHQYYLNTEFYYNVELLYFYWIFNDFYAYCIFQLSTMADRKWEVGCIDCKRDRVRDMLDLLRHSATAIGFSASHNMIDYPVAIRIYSNSLKSTKRMRTVSQEISKKKGDDTIVWFIFLHITVMIHIFLH